MKDLRLLLPVLICLLAISCSSIHPAKIENLNQKSYRNYTLYYQQIIPEKQIEDYDVIYDNLYFYMTRKLGLQLEQKKANVVILPVENEVVDFETMGSSACTDYKNIYLLDFFNLAQTYYSDYGEPPEGIENNSFVHELAHVFSYNIIKYKRWGKFEPEEMNSMFLSYIDFTTTEFKIDKNVYPVIVQYNFTADLMNSLRIEGITALKNASNNWGPAIFLLYLHTVGDYGGIITFLEARNIEEYVKLTNWEFESTERFIKWIEAGINV